MLILNTIFNHFFLAKKVDLQINFAFCPTQNFQSPMKYKGHLHNFITTISFILHLTAPLLLVDEDDDTEHNNLSDDSQEWPQCCKFVCNRGKHNNSTIILEIFSTNDQIAASRSVPEENKTLQIKFNSVGFLSLNYMSWYSSFQLSTILHNVA